MSQAPLIIKNTSKSFAFYEHQSKHQSKHQSTHNQHLLSAVICALLGFAILIVVGFSPIEVIHNATHDTRHSTGFPCH